MSETASGGTSGLPAELLAWIRRYAEVSPDGDLEDLLAGARRALGYTRRHPGRDREAAYSLLAADGLLTLAVGRVAHAEDPEAGLREVFAALAGEAGSWAGPTPGDSVAGGSPIAGEGSNAGLGRE